MARKRPPSPPIGAGFRRDHLTSFASQLPTYVVVAVRRAEYAGCRQVVVDLACPRTACQKQFTVQREHYWNEHHSGQCPYCSKTAWRGDKP